MNSTPSAPTRVSVKRVEAEAAAQSHSDGDFRAGDEVHRVRVGVVARWEVAVVGSDDGVALAPLDFRTVPLSDAGAAGVGQHGAADLFQRRLLAVPFYGRPDLLGPGGHHQTRSRHQTVGLGLAGHVGAPAHVLVGRVGAATHQRHRYLVREVVLGDFCRQCGDGTGPVRRVRAGDMGFQLGKVYFHDAVIVLRRVPLHLGVGGQQVAVLLGQGGEFRPSGRPQVGTHALVIGEYVPGGPQFGAHVGNGGLAGTTDGLGTRAEVFDDGVGAAGHGQHPGQMDDDVLGGSPPAHLSGKANPNQRGVSYLPGQAGHHVGSVGPADADGEHSQSAGVGSVGVGADNQPAGKGVVLQNDLVDNARPRLPEAHAELAAGGLQELVDLIALVEGVLQVRGSPDTGLDQVVAMDGGRNGYPGAPGLHELQDSHLSGYVLVGHPVRVEHDVALAGVQFRIRRVIQVSQHDLFRQGQRAVEARPDDFQLLFHLLVGVGNEFRGRVDHIHNFSPPQLGRT